MSLVYSYFINEHNRNGLTGFGSDIFAGVRNGQSYDNAFYQNGKLFFCPGRPFSKDLDVIGHEFTHGVTDFSAQLKYENQSGALNEAMSDILGEMVELYVNGSNDWLIGANSGPALRNMANPEMQGQPSKMSQFRQLSIDQDYGGVHSNSGIINKSFYNLSQSKTSRIAAKVYYRCLTKYLKPQDKFIDCRLGCINAAEDLYPSDLSIKRAVEAAFDSVEIYDGNPTPTPGSFPPVNAADSYLVLYKKTTQTNYSLARREEAESDNIAQSYTKFFNSVNRSKPFVSGGGSKFAFVTADNNLAVTTTLRPAQDVEYYDVKGLLNSVAITPDGLGVVWVLKNTNKIVLRNRVSGVLQTNKLYTPVSGGILLDNIKYADVVSLSPDGRFLVYDAVVQSTNGLKRFLWSNYLMDVATGQIWHLINSGDDYDVGNPAFGHTSNNFITYERIDWKTGSSKIMVYDQFSNRHSEIATVNGLGFPEFNGDDSALVFSDTDSQAKATGRSLFKVSLDKSRQLVAGTRSLAIQDANMAVVYRRGAYRTTNEPPTVTWTSPASGSSVAQGASLTLAVSAVDQDGIERVEFWQGARNLDRFRNHHSLFRWR